MKKYRIKKESKDLRWPEDCQLIQAVLKQHGCEATLFEVQKLWEGYSENYAASWLILPDNDSDIWEYLKDQLEEIPEKGN